MDRRECPEIYQYIHGELNFGNSSKAVQWGKKKHSFFPKSILEKLHLYTLKKELQSIASKIYKY